MYCLSNGCQLGWLIDPSDRSILGFWCDRPPQLFLDNQPLPSLENILLSLTANQIFDWLTVVR